MNIELMTPQTEHLYEDLNLSKETHLLYTSLKYRNFLRRILSEAEDLYLLAFDQGLLVGALPLFSFEGRYGLVINSLPFYGSNGGILTAPGLDDALTVKRELMRAFIDLSIDKKAVTTTIVSNPFDVDIEFYETYCGYTFIDERIGQITQLPLITDNSQDSHEIVMRSFHSKTRNMVRKAQKQGFIVNHSDDNAVLTVLYELHTDNIISIGGLPKPWSVFSAISDTFEYDKEYRVYVAKHENQVVAALLLFYYNKTVEYFTPAIHRNFRSQQPLSLLIFEAMHDACKAGFRYWNWGGTWLSQQGVYLFKKRWGSTDKRYRYFVREFSSVFRSKDRKELMESYKFFYTIPFSMLERP